MLALTPTSHSTVAPWWPSGLRRVRTCVPWWPSHLGPVPLWLPGGPPAWVAVGQSAVFLVADGFSGSEDATEDHNNGMCEVGELT